MSKILAIKARQILDSRGNPTVEVDLKINEGIVQASVPSGASTGKHEALELRDKERAFAGKGVLKAVKNVNSILAKKLVGTDCTHQDKIDELMMKLDGTANKARIGANAILAVSLAVCRAGALARKKSLYQHIANTYGNKKLELPIPFFNVINGGKHAGNELDFQEYMIAPTGAKTFTEAMQIGAEVHHSLKSILAKKYGSSATNVGDEGGFAPALSKVEEPLHLLTEAVAASGHKQKVSFAVDCAASEFYQKGFYTLEGQRQIPYQLMDRYKELARKYPLVSIEDPFAEDDFASFRELNHAIGHHVQIVGDDLLVTNVERIKKALHEHACNALLLKVNQIGTVTEALAAAKLAQKNHWKVMVSHRSGETDDSFIADLAVGIGAGQIKAGAPCRGERLAKYNQLLRIEEEFGKKAVYAGKSLRFA